MRTKITDKPLRLENMPTDVAIVMSVQMVGYCGTKMYDQCIKTIEKYPEWFPWETAYSKVPQEVHDSFEKECYPNKQTIEEIIAEWKDIPRKSIMEQINENAAEYKMPTKEEILGVFDGYLKRQKEAAIEQERVERIWNKHYKKYKLPYRP